MAVGTRLPAEALVALERLRVEPSGRYEAHLAEESRVISLRSGTLTVSIDERSPEPALLAARQPATPADRPRVIPSGSAVALTAGDLLALPAPTRYVLSNDASAVAEALVVAVYAPGAPGRAAARVDPAYGATGSGASADEHQTSFAGVAVEPLTGGRLTALPPDLAAVHVGTATLFPGARLGPFETVGPVLLHAAAGTLDVDAPTGAVWVRRGGEGRSGDLDREPFVSGDGALIRSGAVVSVSNPGNAPAVVLVVAIVPDGDPDLAP